MGLDTGTVLSLRLVGTATLDPLEDMEGATSIAARRLRLAVLDDAGPG